jgi:hypothetical protein
LDFQLRRTPLARRCKISENSAPFPVTEVDRESKTREQWVRRRGPMTEIDSTWVGRVICLIQVKRRVCRSLSCDKALRQLGTVAARGSEMGGADGDGVPHAAMARNARDAADYFKLPSNRVIELGTQVEI